MGIVIGILAPIVVYIQLFKDDFDNDELKEVFGVIAVAVIVIIIASIISGVSNMR